MSTASQNNLIADKLAIQEWIVCRVARELGAAAEEIDPEARLMNLGLDSLTLIGLAGELAELINQDLPAELLWEYETIAAISSYLSRQTSPLSEGKTCNFTTADATVSNTHFADANRWSPVRAVQPRGTKTPLFLVHGAGGEASYSALSNLLGNDQPVFVLRQTPDPPETIEEMARLLNDGMRTIQRKGPYCVGGYCFGGVMAYEMARQLQLEGERVHLVAMFDPPAPRQTPLGLVSDAKTWAAVLVYGAACGSCYLGREVLHKPRHTLARFGRRLGRWGHQAKLRLGVDAAPLSERLVAEMFENPSPMHQKNFAAMRNYCPQPFSGRLSIYQSAEFRYFHGTIPWRWAKLAQQGIHITRVKGEHTMMLNAPAVQGVADVLATQLASRLNP